MLSVLHIENIAVIEQADLLFDGGFNVLTGETGAGKSIVIDAISAILGERTPRDVIRTGSDRAMVSAVFSPAPDEAWFQENKIDYDPNELLVQREIYLDGKNACRVNGRPVTVAMLKKLGAQLVCIHGQHDSQQLFDEANHLTLLDLFAQNEPQLLSYQQAFAAVQRVRQEIDHLSMDEGEKLRLQQTLRDQVDEIDRAQLTAGEDDALEARRKTLQHAEKLTQALQDAVGALYGDESTDGAAGLIAEAARSLSRVGRFSDELAETAQTVEELSYAVQDAADGLRAMLDDFTYSAGDLEQIEQRLDTLHKLKRKYGPTVSDVLAFRDRVSSRLDEIEFSTDRIVQLQQELSKLEGSLQTAAQALRHTRQTAANALQSRIQRELSQLDMPRVQFVCQFEPVPPGPTGADAVRFLMSANVGESLKPLSKIASGGELARIMLAMKNVLAELDAVPTLIFDEVDAGVSGRAAQKVAEKLWSVSRGRQVLCVTHLPQIAAMADTHFIVEKSVKNERTYTNVLQLDRAQRRQELSRITGGSVVSPALLQGAEELLSACDAYKHAGG